MSVALALYYSHRQYSIQFLRTVLQSLRRISTVYTTLSSMSDLTEPGFKVRMSPAKTALRSHSAHERTIM